MPLDDKMVFTITFLFTSRFRSPGKLPFLPVFFKVHTTHNHDNLTRLTSDIIVTVSEQVKDFYVLTSGTDGNILQSATGHQIE